MSKSNQRLGNLTKDDINFPKHLTPEIVHTALYIHNAPSNEDIKERVEFSIKQIGEEALSYAMALLVLPTLIDNMARSQTYKDWKESKKKTLN
jgi:hypothetical protein|tara:strand:- start:103 stop:381 length:279 start_codon:yes stop_codon:yes gene_type:complete